MLRCRIFLNSWKYMAKPLFLQCKKEITFHTGLFEPQILSHFESTYNHMLNQQCSPIFYVTDSYWTMLLNDGFVDPAWMVYMVSVIWLLFCFLLTFCIFRLYVVAECVVSCSILLGHESILKSLLVHHPYWGLCDKC